MAILRSYDPRTHDVHLYSPDATVPGTVGIQWTRNPSCQCGIDFTGVSLRPRAFSIPVPDSLVQPTWTAPLDRASVNFWNTSNPCAVAISPRHALVCQHYRGLHPLPRPGEHYQFMGSDGVKQSAYVSRVALDVGPDHTLLEFDAPLRDGIAVYSRVADARYIPAGTAVWVHDSQGRAYKVAYGKATVNASGEATGFTFAPVLDGTNDGIRSNGLACIFTGDSGSPAFVEGRGGAVLVGLMHGGMQLRSSEVAALNSQMAPMGYALQVERLSAHPADINQDGVVDGADQGLLLAQWGNLSPECDVNRDGTIDGLDLGLLLSAWGPQPVQPNTSSGGSGLVVGGQQ